MSTTSRHLVPLLAVAALLLAGCGGDDTDAVTDDEPDSTAPDDDTGDETDDETDDADDEPADETDDGADEPADDGADDRDTEGASDTGSDDADMEDDAGTGGDEPADVQVGSTELGDVLVDADGMTLYLFTNDSDGQSVCDDDCAVAWPPLTVDAEPVAGDGVDTGLLGTAERDDGSTQVTYDGSPLYTWASDSEPGDVTGQGVSDVWFVVAPDGEAIMGSDDSAAGAAGY